MSFGPIDYSINVQTPFQSAMQGLSGGLAIKQVQDEQAAKAAQAAAARQMAGDLATFSQKQGRTAADYASIVAKYPQLSEHFKRAWDMESPDVKSARVSEMSNVFSAVHNGAPDVAVDLLTKKAEAARNRGDAQTAASSEALIKLIKTNPEAAKTAVGLGLYASTSDEKFAETLVKLGGERRADAKLPVEIAQTTATTASTLAAAEKTKADTAAIVAGLPFVAPKARADLQNTLSQIADRAGRLALDRDKLMTETQLKLREMGQKAGELPPDASKIVNESTAGAVASQQTAAQMLDLAKRLEGAGGGYGGFSTASEFFKNATGNQDAMSALRQEYTRMRNSAAIKSLPPGPATDKDIALALKGFPSETADTGTIASFLRGMAKIQQIDAATGEAKAEWVASVKNLGRAPRDITVLGVQVPAGTTFADFSRHVVENRAREQTTLTTIQSSPYADFAAAPTAAAPLTPEQQAPEPQ